NGYFGALFSPFYQRTRRVEGEVETDRDTEPGGFRIASALELLVGTSRIVAQTLKLKARLGPELSVFETRRAEHLVALDAEAYPIIAAEPADCMNRTTQTDVPKA